MRYRVVITENSYLNPRPRRGYTVDAPDEDRAVDEAADIHFGVVTGHGSPMIEAGQARYYIHWGREDDLGYATVEEEHDE